MGRQSRKLFNKRATSRENVERIKNIDGRDEQVADVRGGNLNDNAITRRVINQGAVGFDEVGIAQIGGNRIFDGGVLNSHIQNRAVSTGKMADLSVGFGQIANGAVGPQKLDRAYLTPSQGDSNYAFKSHSHSVSTALSGTAYSHSHSISSTTFIKQPFEVRMRMLNDRLDLEDLLKMWRLPRSLKVIVRNILNILILLMDYRELNAYQRERAFVTEGLEEWTQEYKRVYGVDEYAEDDRENFLRYGDVRMDPYTGIAPSGAQSPKDPGD